MCGSTLKEPESARNDKVDFYLIIMKMHSNQHFCNVSVLTNWLILKKTHHNNDAMFIYLLHFT